MTLVTVIAGDGDLNVTGNTQLGSSFHDALTVAAVSDFNANANANAGLDVSGGPLTFTGTAGSWTTAQADSALTQTGTGQVTLTGNLDATNGLDVTTANLTVGGTRFVVELPLLPSGHDADSGESGAGDRSGSGVPA